MSRIVYWKGRQQITKQGGISSEVWNTKFLQDYLKSGIVAGYVGASSRTLASDRVLEKRLRKLGMGPNAIGIWMTSGTGRHLMDDKPTAKRIFDYTKTAPRDVAIWDDPRHEGTLGSSMRLSNEYSEEAVKLILRRIG